MSFLVFDYLYSAPPISFYPKFTAGLWLVVYLFPEITHILSKYWFDMIHLKFLSSEHIYFDETFCFPMFSGSVEDAACF